jgi:hypothetical protein
MNHRQALAVKMLETSLKDMLNEAIKIVNHKTERFLMPGNAL